MLLIFYPKFLNFLNTKIDLNAWIKVENDKIKSTKPVVEETSSLLKHLSDVRKAPVAKLKKLLLLLLKNQNVFVKAPVAKVETPAPVVEKPKTVRKTPVAKVEETPEVPIT